MPLEEPQTYLVEEATRSCGPSQEKRRRGRGISSSRCHVAEIDTDLIFFSFFFFLFPVHRQGNDLFLDMDIPIPT